MSNITCTADADFAELKYTVNADKATVTLPANDGAPRQVVVTFTDGYAETSVTVVQGADTTKQPYMTRNFVNLDWLLVAKLAKIL